ncbi:MAG TPA: porin, partial [Burkholderiales bacterium]|nr:porin [Burkholderiales bacterium]
IAPGGAFADAVMITGGTGITVPEKAAGTAYFGLKGRDDLVSRLRDNVIQYWTPNFDGLRAGIAYAGNHDSASLAGVGTASDLSFLLDYKLGAVSAFVGGESGWGGNPFGIASSDTHVGAAYEFSTGTHFGLGYGQLRYNFSAAGAPSFNSPAKGNVQMNDWYLSLVQDVGSSGHLRFSFTQADNGNAGQGAANQLSLGYGQALSDRTEIYALYTKTNNTYNFGTNPFGLGMGSSIFGLGLKHSF